MDEYYGFDPDEIKNKACCEWHSFIDSFVDKWKKQTGYPPDRETVIKARRNWSMYSMTGWEAYMTLTREMRLRDVTA